MSKIIIFDGVDNAGKTWLIERLEQLFGNIGTCHFPSNALANSDIFRNVCDNPSDHSINMWLDALFEEEYTVLNEMLPNYDTILIDRMWLSSLMYQGTGIEFNFMREREISSRYIDLFKRLDIVPDMVHQLVFMFPLTYADASEKNETKRKYDAQSSKMVIKLDDLVNNRFWDYCSNFFAHMTFFNERNLLVPLGGTISIETVEKVQWSRLVRIVDKILRVGRV